MSSLYRFVKGKISLAPNNASSWNYFRGILNHVHMPYSTQAAFVELYVVDAVEEDVNRVLDLENPPPSEGAQLPCPAAIEFMADVHEARGKVGITEAVKVRPFLVFIPYSPMSCVVIAISSGMPSLTHTIP
jgi:protein farnesyltransferase/geranylgeranyltransferase type-1 subunit alpha